MTDNLEAVREARLDRQTAERLYREAVKTALNQGAKVVDVAEAAGCSRQGVYQLVKRNR